MKRKYLNGWDGLSRAEEQRQRYLQSQTVVQYLSNTQMHNWNKDSLNLQVGDQIIWQDAEIKEEDGPAIVSPGMKGQIISLHDGFQMDQVQGGSVPPKALVQFESGESLLVDKRMKWEKVSKS